MCLYYFIINFINNNYLHYFIQIYYQFIYCSILIPHFIIISIYYNLIMAILQMFNIANHNFNISIGLFIFISIISTINYFFLKIIIINQFYIFDNIKFPVQMNYQIQSKYFIYFRRNYDYSIDHNDLILIICQMLNDC